ncbi:DUF1592 domain-containing protein [Gemmatimonas aurantiaca]|uniref:DUF1592 domain-containing protein n=1 Tax=Gemmatimonas aurantiaca TaxID=173480 RepID=UPI00301BF747
MKVLFAWSGITATVTLVTSLLNPATSPSTLSSTRDGNATDPVRPASMVRTATVRTPEAPVPGPVAGTHSVLARPMSPTKAKAKYGARGIEMAALDSTVQRYCGSCHNPARAARSGNLSLRGYSVDSAVAQLSVSEKMIRKLRAEMMPPPGSKRPGGDTLLALVETLEQTIDEIPVNPGTRVFQRLNRPEYQRVVRDLLALEIDPGDWLPLDTKSANFDNISDAQALSPTLLEGYLNAASAVSRMAIGDRKAPPGQFNYRISPFVSQHPWDYVEGTPYGTRGGMLVTHTFPADGIYQIRVNVGGGVGRPVEDVDVSIDGERVALLHYDRGVARNSESADLPLGADYLLTEPIAVKGGQRKVSVAFVRRAEGPYEDLIKPHEWSRASSGTGAAGTTEPAYLMEFLIMGPSKITGLSDSPSRKAIFTCNPQGAAAQRTCAESILTRLATRAYRRPLNESDRKALMTFYDRGVANGGDQPFEEGVRLGLQALLVSPHFIFRIEREPDNAAAGKDYRIDDLELASRLSFFLWSTIPDERLLTLARQKRLSTPAVFNAEVKRMLADPRAEALSTRFAAQWLRLQDLEKVHPDAFLFPDFDQQLAESMERETELFFEDLVRKDRSVLTAFTAESTFVNERLAKHYGIPGVVGTHFRKVAYADDQRRGVLGQGSVLVQTSLGNRTSPVLRGKWVMEVLLGAPPPPPPPNVPDLEQTAGAKEGKQLTTRERMEMHRENPSCNSCHNFIDPIGLALDNFDVTGKLRYRENGALLDTRGKLYDGTAINTPTDLSHALLKRPIPLMRNFTENLMAYALGRRVEDYDQPTVRSIERQAAKQQYRMSAFVMGVVNSKAFHSKRAEPVSADASQNN